MGVSRDVASSTTGNITTRRIGTKLYELTDHLGSVRALIPDIKLPSGDTFLVEPVIVYEYDAYGVMRVTRSADLANPYRYGFQGMLRMSEVSSSNTVVNDYSTLFRTYDARTGRWTSHDPILQPYQSTYSGLDGNPAMLTDWYGLKTSTLASPLAPGTGNSESSNGGMTFGFATDPGLSLQSYIVTPFFAPISVSAPVIGLYIPSPSVTTEGNNPFVMIPRGVYDGFVRDGLNEDLKAIGELPETISGLRDELLNIAQDPERLAALVFEYFADRPALTTICLLNPALAPTLILADILVPSLIEQICEDATAITGILPLNLIPKLIKEDYYGAGYDYGKGLYTAIQYIPLGGGILKGISILKKFLPKTAKLLGKLAKTLLKSGGMLDDMLNAGNRADRGGLSAAGRALEKHGGRKGSAFPKASGNVDSKNKQGADILEEIVTNPQAEVIFRSHHIHGNVIDVRLPSGKGARFSEDGKTFHGFLEPNNE